MDARIAIDHGADAIGMVFYPPSPRNVTISQAYEICKAVPAFVNVVGLFVDADPSWVDQVLAELPIGLLQFHGDESPIACRSFAKPYMKAIRVRPDSNLIQYASDFFDARALLLDAYAEGVPGGTGKVFDWNLIPQNMAMPVVLAGGLDASNVAEAIQQVHPYAVDVSGGVEKSKGIKDADKIAAFMRGVSNASL